MSRILTLIALTIAAASGSSAGAASLDSPRLQQVETACAQMGLTAGQVQYDDCIVTLARSVGSANALGPTGASHAACARVGLQPGTPEFTSCTADLDQTLAQDSSSQG
jgi:hypothetical protein